MSELQNYYNEFSRGYWADEDESECLCHGTGWACSDVDTWHKCPIHFVEGQRHPEDSEDYEAEEPFVAHEVEPSFSPLGDDEIPF